MPNEGPWRLYAKQVLEEQCDELKKQLVDDNVAPQPGKQPTGSLVKEIEEDTQGDWSYLEHPLLYRGIVLLYLLGQCALTAYAALQGWFSITIDLVPHIPINPGLAVLILQGAHLFVSLKFIQVDELAGIDIFGKPLYKPKAGLYVVPYGILTLTVTLRNYRDVRFPGPADKIYRVSTEMQKSQSDTPPPGSDMVRPIFVTTGEPKLTGEEQKERSRGERNPLDEQLNIEISYFVRFRPGQDYGGIFRLIRNVGGIRGKSVKETTKRIEDLMREQSERDIKSIATQQTYATIVENWELFNEVFGLKLQASILRLGVQVDPRGAGLDDANPSHETNETQMEVSRERFRRQQVIVKADGEKQKRALEGRGDGEATRYRLEGLAAGYKKIREDSGVSGEAVIASETAKAALSEKTDTLVLGTGGIEQLFGLVKAGQGMLNRGGPNRPAPESPDNNQPQEAQP